MFKIKNKQNENLLEILESKITMCDNLKKENEELNSKYIELLCIFNKLYDLMSSRNTQYITFNDKIFLISKIDYHKESGSVAYINVTAFETKKQKGLKDNLSDTFKDVADTFSKIWYGDK